MLLLRYDIAARTAGEVLLLVVLVCNLGFISDEHITSQTKNISALAKSCYLLPHIHELRCIAYPPIYRFQNSQHHCTFTVHCNSLYHNLLNCQLNWIQHIQNSLARAVVKAPKFTPTLKSIRWLKVTERIEYTEWSKISGTPDLFFR